MKSGFELPQKGIKFSIDKVFKDEKSYRTTIQGWAFNVEAKHAIRPKVINNGAFNVKYMKDFRVDVNNKYFIPDDVTVGFIIELDEKSYNKKVEIQFEDQGYKQKVRINLKKRYDSTKKFDDYMKVNVLNKLLKAASYYQRNGLTNTLKKICFELKGRNQEDYNSWIDTYESYDAEAVMEEIRAFQYQPKLSIVMPVFNVEAVWLRDCIDSVIKQTYTNWELCIADDHSTTEHIKPLLEAYEKEDVRIKVVYREENGHISEATNSALKIATGEFVGLLDNDDTLAPFALYEVVKLLNEHPEADLIYSDEDKLSEEGKRSQPFFKTDWAPDILLATNYICHLGVYRKTIIDEIGGFRKGYEGAQDYDLVLRFTEKTDNIFHIQKILYHWRMIGNSTAVNPDSKGYAYEAGKKSLEDALERRGLKGTVSHGAFPGIYNVAYEIVKDGLISIIIPTRDNAADLKECVDSIFEKADDEKFEIIIADNGSEKEETLKLFDVYTKKYMDQFRVVRLDMPFNFSRINNLAVKEARGDYLLFLNNDIKVITQGWLKKMMSLAQQERIGAVGAKLYYPDNTIQHAGVLLGMGGVAGHGHCGYPRGDYGYFGKLVINNNYSAVTAACLMVKRKDFEAVGGFEEKLIVTFNDVDFCLKLLERKKNNIWLYDVELFHFESKSRGEENTYEKQQRFRNEINYMKENWLSYIKNDPFYNINLAKSGNGYTINTNR